MTRMEIDTSVSPCVENLHSAIDDAVIIGMRWAREDGRTDRDALREVHATLATHLGIIAAHLSAHPGALEMVLHETSSAVRQEAHRTHAALSLARGVRQ